MSHLTPDVLRWLALVLVVAVAAGLALHIRRRRRVAARIGDAHVLRELLGMELARVPVLRTGAVALAAVALALALVDPSIAAARATQRGPVVFVMDASGSMLVEDVGQPRLQLQRSLARAVAEALPDLPIGIVAFAGRAYSLTPPTRDRGSVEMYLATLDPTIVTQTGSALGAAVRQGIGLLMAGESAAGGTIVLFSDGDETEDTEAASAAASLARQANVAIHTVVAGTAEGGSVPAVDGATGAVGGYLRDPGGQVIVSRANDALLRAIAGRTGGIHLAAADPNAVEVLAEALRGAAPRGEPEPGGVPGYVLLAAGAFLLLLLEPLAGPRGRVR